MTQANLITAGAGGFLALVLMYLTLRMRLVATSGEQESRSVSQVEYQIAQMSAWMDYSMSCVGRMLVLTFIFIAPLVALGPTLFSEKAGADFSFRAYFFAIVLVIAPTLLVARKSFSEGRYSSATSDIAYARKEAARSNRRILLRAFFAAVIYALFLGFALMLLGAAWWVYGLVIIGVLFASLIVMIGLSD